MLKRALSMALILIMLFTVSSCNRPIEDKGEANPGTVKKTESNTTTDTATSTQTETPVTSTTEETTATSTTEKPTTTTTAAPEPEEPETIIVTETNGIKTVFDTTTGVLTVSGDGMVENLFPRHLDDGNEYDDTTVKQLVIEEGITYVKNSFNHLVDLESIQMPSTLHTIEESFIELYSMTALTIPATVKKIFNQSFDFNHFYELTFEGPIEISCPGSFLRTPVKSLRIPAGSILCDAFDCCLMLEELILEPGVTFLDHNAHECNVTPVGIAYDEDNYSFDCQNERVKVSACAPIYQNGSEMSEDEVTYRLSTIYAALLIPEGDSLENYQQHEWQISEFWFDTAIDPSEQAGQLLYRYGRRVKPE